jgi:diguanylate cyclase
LNDRFGHIEGDKVLAEIAARIKDQLRVQDVLARYAGDEFVVILPGVPMRVSLEIAARLLRAVRSRPFELTNGENTVVTLSIGAATYPEDGDTDEELIGAADTAMYLAKGYGRDAVCHFRDVALLDSGVAREPLVRLNP